MTTREATNFKWKAPFYKILNTDSSKYKKLPSTSRFFSNQSGGKAVNLTC